MDKDELRDAITTAQDAHKKQMDLLFPDFTMRQLQQRLRQEATLEKSIDLLTARVRKLETQMTTILENQKLLTEGQNLQIKLLQ